MPRAGGRTLAAAFDTRLDGVPAFTGRASHPIGKLLKRHGWRIVAAPESFLVSKQNALLDGEAERARRWGTALGAASQAYSPRAPESPACPGRQRRRQLPAGEGADRAALQATEVQRGHGVRDG